MKLYRLLLLLVAMSVVCCAGAQRSSVLNSKISLSERNRPLSEVFQKIEEQTGVIFSFNSKILNTSARVSVAASNRRLGDVLSGMLPQNVGYKAISKNIVLFRKEPSKALSRQAKPQVAELPLPVADTVFVYKTDTITVVKTVVDTVYRTTERVVRLTDTVFRDRKSLVQKRFGAFCQHLALTTEYSHWGPSSRSKADRSEIDSCESQPDGFRLGLLGSYGINRFAITYGIAWTHITERQCYSAESILFGSDSLVRVTRQNQYNYLSFPLLVGWQYHIANNFDIEANAGCWINLRFSTKGQYLSLSGDSSSVASLKDAPLNNATIDLSANVALSYKVFRNLSIALYPSYHYQAVSDFRKSYPIVKRRTGFGYAAAIFYTF